MFIHLAMYGIYSVNCIPQNDAIATANKMNIEKKNV